MPGRWLRTAPAPSQSSREGRSDPSGHRSPAGITLNVLPARLAAAATARALRRQAANTTDPDPAAASDTRDPLGDGSTQRKPGGASRNDDADSERLASRRRPASSAPCARANSAADG